MVIRFFKLGNSPINYTIDEGSSVRNMMDEKNIMVDGAFTISVNSKTVNDNHQLSNGDNVVVSRSEIKGGRK